MEAAVKFTIEGQSFEYVNEYAQCEAGSRWCTPNPAEVLTTIETAGDLLKKKTLTLTVKSVEASAELLQFTAISKTVKVSRTPNGSAGKFSAVVQGVDPRNGQPSKEITVGCSYSYEI